MTTGFQRWKGIPAGCCCPCQRSSPEGEQWECHVGFAPWTNRLPRSAHSANIHHTIKRALSQPLHNLLPQSRDVDDLWCMAVKCLWQTASCIRIKGASLRLTMTLSCHRGNGPVCGMHAIFATSCCHGFERCNTCRVEERCCAASSCCI